MDPYDPPLDKARHLRYWQRCVRTLLPHHYTSMDSTRLSLAFFIIASVDLLTTPSSDATKTDKPLLTAADRLRLRRWVLSCQHPSGGFCASPTHVLPCHHQRDDVENAHVGGTYFALLLLALLSDDDDADSAFAGVDRVATLRWLRRLQRPEDGSFGEVVHDPPQGGQPFVAGGRDMRYCYLAAAVRWMLRGDTGTESQKAEEEVEDIDVPALVAHIRRGQTYDGGFSESRANESHAGYGYCAVAALALLDRPPEGTPETQNHAAGDVLRKGIPDAPALVRWLSARQFEYVQRENGADDDDDPETSNFHQVDLPSSSADPSAPPQVKHIGFNGRCNKIADTCYTWWNLGTQAVLDENNITSILSSSTNDSDADTPNLRARRAFLLDKTQHIIGGFGKNVGSPPDVGHACLGLAALALMRDPSLRRLDPALCVSVDAVRRVERARRGLLHQGAPVRHEQTEGGERKLDGIGATDLGSRLVGLAARMGGSEAPMWSGVVELR